MLPGKAVQAIAVSPAPAAPTRAEAVELRADAEPAPAASQETSTEGKPGPFASLKFACSLVPTLLSMSVAHIACGIEQEVRGKGQGSLQWLASHKPQVIAGGLEKLMGPISAFAAREMDLPLKDLFGLERTFYRVLAPVREHGEVQPSPFMRSLLLSTTPDARSQAPLQAPAFVYMEQARYVSSCPGSSACWTRTISPGADAWWWE